MYTLEGEQLTLDGINGNYINPGTYVVKLYYKYYDKYDVFYPYLYEWNT